MRCIWLGIHRTEIKRFDFEGRLVLRCKRLWFNVFFLHILLGLSFRLSAIAMSCVGIDFLHGDPVTDRMHVCPP